MCSLVISVILFACGTSRNEHRHLRIEATEGPLKFMHGPCTNEEVGRKIQDAIGEYDERLNLVKKRNLTWFDHVLRLLI